ncbi:unnamed protein product [Oreochromis niloticus]|nr:unnamed protein product [Mustela putorius furo]
MRMLPDKIKRETEEREVRPRSPAHRVRETALRLSAEAGFSPGLTRLGTFSHRGRDSGGRESTSLGAPSRDVNKHGGAQQAAANIKTPKFSGKTPWEVFIAQFELLAVAAGWSEEHKALQLALCLCEDAAACLLLLTEEQRGDYNALVGALQRRFGQYNKPVLLRSEFHNRRRLPGEPLRILAHEVECLCRRAYDSMPPSVQAELARDQFLQALSPKELRMQTQLARPATLSAALELALEREMLAGSSGGADDTHVVRAMSAPVEQMERLSAPIKVRPRRLPLAHQEAADRELCEMMKPGIIEPSDSPSASAVVMVPKKNSPRMRFCVVYRPLNKVTKKDSYPLPRIDESLDLVAGSSWFSTLDLRSGYWQKDRDFIWTQDCQQAFNTLRRSLTESPVLAPPDPTLPFVLDTDASNVGLGAVLSQVGPEGEKVVAYFSRVLNRTGCRYCEKREETERELTTMDGATQLTCRALLVVDAAKWRARQEQDTDLLPVLQWLEKEERPLWDEDPATGEERWQVVVPRSLRSAVLEACHGSTGSGHFGVSKTLRRLRQGYYWDQQRRDVEDFCRSCDACSSYKGPQEQCRAQLQQQPAGDPMERVAVDVMGPFPRTDRGNCYVLVAMDYFTKWPEAYAIPDQEAETVAEALVEGMFSHFGTAETLHSDQGRNFESKVFAAMCECLGIKKTRTTPLHPQSDGLVERFNRTLAQQLAIVKEHQRDWDYHLPLILMAYRSAVQDSTQCTPGLLMLGRELRTPAELAFGKPPDAPEAPPGRDYARRLQDRLDSAHSYAREQLAKAGLRQKRNYDITTKGRHFRAGELVWVYSPKRKKGRCPKLDSSWVGPCSVLERVGEVVYRVQLPPRGRKVALHRHRMAPYRGQSLPSFPEGRVQSSHDPAQRDPQP